ncbi:MAG: hypothetical protein ACRD68_13905 [Pyrinomonadaceae bacterium]
MYIIPVLGALLTLVLFAASRTVTKDVERLQTWMRETSAEESLARRHAPRRRGRRRRDRVCHEDAALMIAATPSNTLDPVSTPAPYNTKNGMKKATRNFMSFRVASWMVLSSVENE